MRSGRLPFAIAGAIAAFGITAPGALAASLNITASPSSPEAGQTVNVSFTGTADRQGNVQVYRQDVAQSCRPTGDGQRTGNGGGPVYDQIIADQATSPGSFSGSGSFTAAAGRSYRLCGYLGGFNDLSAPDARADVVVNTVVPPPPSTGGGTDGGGTTGGSGGTPTLRVSASTRRPRAGRSVSVTISGTPRVRSGGSSLIVYLNPRQRACTRTSEGERNGRVGRQLLNRNIVRTSAFRFTVRFTARRGGRYRVCAYLGRPDDTRPPDFLRQVSIRTRR